MAVATESKLLRQAQQSGWLLALFSGQPLFVFMYPSDLSFRPMDNLLHVKKESLGRFWRDMQKCFPALQGLYIEPQLARKMVVVPPPLGQICPDPYFSGLDVPYFINARRSIYHAAWTLAERFNMHLISKVGASFRVYAVSWAVLFDRARQSRSIEWTHRFLFFLERMLESMYIDGFLLLFPTRSCGLHVATKGMLYYWGDSMPMGSLVLDAYRFYPDRKVYRFSSDDEDSLLYFWHLPIHMGTY